MTSLRKWFRVEMDLSGAILSCREVAHCQRDGRLICYVTALDKTGACTSAQTWYSETYQKEKSRLRAGVPAKQDLRGTRRLQSVACKHRACAVDVRGGAGINGYCPAHYEEMRANVVPNTGDPKVEARLSVEREQRERARCKANVSLVDLLTRFDSDGPESFREWLSSEIRRRGFEPREAPRAGEVLLPGRRVRSRSAWFQDVLDQSQPADAE